MGSLWVADHLRLRVPVVVKFIAAELAENAEARSRFEREASATMAAKSPNVVQILDYGFTEQGIPFIAMELLEGEDLAKKIEREVRIGPNEYADILRQACRGLTRAHTQGIVHRDIKPENIYLSSFDGELCVKVLDFGIAKADNPMFGLRATKTGVLLGTAYYMSPEQTMGAKNVDRRTDLWSLGVVSYYALTGVRPFASEAIGVLVRDISTTPITPPSRFVPELGPAIDAWMAQALARDPAERFTSAKDMSVAFDAAVVEWRKAVIAEMQPTPPPVLTGAAPNNQWTPAGPSQNAAPPLDPLTRTPAKRWAPTIQGAPESIPMGTVYPVVANSDSTTHSKRSVAPYLVGVGIGVAACIAVLMFWGRSTTAVQPLLAVPEIVHQDASPLAESTPPTVAPAPEAKPIPAPAETAASPSGARAPAGVVKARAAASPSHKPTKKATLNSDNPFNGSY
jgi:serine/threonine-protein kinase